MFEEILTYVANELRENDGDEPDFHDILEKAALMLIETINSQESKNVESVISANDAFIKRNRERWSIGFTKLHALRETCLEAGMNFQQQFIKLPKYENDELIGVFMRQHAHACRISGEIIHLLEGGYPDAALARWRTLFEMVVTCLVIQKCGREAAIDFIKHGMVQTAEGIEEHRKTAEAMKQETFTDEEAKFYSELKGTITNGEPGWHWARKHTGLKKIDKLREFVGLEKWSHNYKLASRNVHSDYYEMASLYGMREAKQDLLLCGQSNSGLTEPAHFMAISLAQITSIFLTTYIDDKESDLDYTDSILFMKIIDNYVNEVGQAFLEAEKPI
ncbi:Uncharacterised protein [Vibrio cholerae]|uniref:DUF5677 domain-containing protein n=1 Tax=Vibrio cholerae TaxID=666 RepID=UPI0011BD50CD|nr:DUF5677 domain-containing protein [Vibrio cholerae]ELV8759741.1 hypothetical protein [Vibrio vulnificus]QKU87396.1 hypothetical protein HPY06_14735 [Vibrio cholerae]CAB1262244.1 Uncharacterised protein [Vibrio cholerae]HAS8106959.1 hypothetical protein [Vibrio vulnificus]